MAVAGHVCGWVKVGPVHLKLCSDATHKDEEHQAGRGSARGTSVSGSL